MLFSSQVICFIFVKFFHLPSVFISSDEHYCRDGQAGELSVCGYCKGHCVLQVDVQVRTLKSGICDTVKCSSSLFFMCSQSFISVLVFLFATECKQRLCGVTGRSLFANVLDHLMTFLSTSL